MTQWTFCPECAEPLIASQDQNDSLPSCPDGHFVRYDNPLPTTIAIIESDGLYLLVRRALQPEAGRWDAVGGFLQGAESAEECLVREAFEEIGVRVVIGRILGTFPSVYGDSGLKTIGIAFECKLTSDKLELSGENSEYGWFGANELPDLAFPDVRAAYTAAVHANKVTSQRKM